MILKNYFDGGNQADSTLFDVVTLASVSGITEQLKAFNADWNAALKKNSAPWLHTTDLFSRRREPFTGRDGWDSGKSEALILDCVEVCRGYQAACRAPPY